jgi:hypothetical protein
MKTTLPEDGRRAACQSFQQGPPQCHQKAPTRASQPEPFG